MSTAELRKKVKKEVDSLNARQLKEAAKMIRKLREDEAATEELLRIPGFVKSLQRGLKDIREGRVVNWRDVRRDV